MKHARTLIALTLPLTALLAVACTKIPHEAFRNRGGPESLLDISTEMVNVNLDSSRSLDQLAEWLHSDQPSRIELSCEEANDICQQAQRIIQQYSVPYTIQPNPTPVASLLYDRVLARDCDNRYLDNPINPHSMPHPTFGCSTASNMLMMISDKQQLISPSLSDFQDGRKADQSVNSYLKPSEDNVSFGSLVGN